MGLKKKIGKFFRKIGIGKKKHKGGDEGTEDVSEYTEPNSEVQERVSRQGPPVTHTPVLDMLSGDDDLDGDNALSEVDDDDRAYGWSSTEEDPEEDVLPSGGSDSGSVGGYGGDNAYGSRFLDELDDEELTSSEDVSGEDDVTISDDELSSSEDLSEVLSDEDVSVSEDGGGGTGSGTQYRRSGDTSGLDLDDLSDDDDLSISDSDEDEDLLLVGGGGGTDFETVAAIMARFGKLPEKDVRERLDGDWTRTTDVLRQGKAAGVFWAVGGDVFSRPYVLSTYASRLAADAAQWGGIDENDLLAECADPTAQGHPVKAKEVVQFALDQGYLGPGNDDGKLEVKTPGLGAIARAKSESGDGNSRETRSNTGQGWATLGMVGDHRGYDRDKGVEYHRTKEQREPTVLQLQGGVFTWAQSGEEAEGPDLSGLDPEKDHKQIFEMSPNFVVLREKELLAKGMPGKEAYLKAIQEVQNNPRLIFVMDSGGTFYATEAKLGEIHHSSLLGGLDVAAAGEIALSGGKVTYVSDASGHYLPGPAYTWQALHEMGAQGVSMGAVDVQMFGVQSIVKADWFLRNFTPGIDLPMKSADAVKLVNDVLKTGEDRGGEAPDAKGKMSMSGFSPPEVANDVDEDDEESSVISFDDSEDSDVDDKPVTKSKKTSSYNKINEDGTRTVIRTGDGDVLEVDDSSEELELLSSSEGDDLDDDVTVSGEGDDDDLLEIVDRGYSLQNGNDDDLIDIVDRGYTTENGKDDDEEDDVVEIVDRGYVPNYED